MIKRHNKMIKTILAAIMILAFAFPLTVSGAADSPSEAVKQDIESFKNRIRENGIEGVFDLGDTSAYTEEDLQLLSERLCDFDYEILKEKTDGDTATVEVRVTTYKFGAALSKAARGLFFDGVTSKLTGSEQVDAETIANTLREKLLGLEKKKYSKKAVINCKKDDTGWTTDLYSNEKFIDEAFGGVVSVVKKYEKWF